MSMPELDTLLVKPAVTSSTIDVLSDGYVLPCFVDLRNLELPYAVAKYPVTNQAYHSFLEHVPRTKLLYTMDKRFNRPDHPVVGVNFPDASEYCRWLSGLLNAKVELPDVATWELLARGGQKKTYATFEDRCDLDVTNVALWLGGTNQVRRYPSNEYGIHDMTGNVLEWTSTIPLDSQMRPEYGAMPVQKPEDLARNRILKGGCWAFSRDNSRIDAITILTTHSNYYTTGFRPLIRFC